MTKRTQETQAKTIEFSPQGKRVVEGKFDGGSMTGDAGVMLLSKVDRKLGLSQAAARHITDPRDPLRITHTARDMLRQRIYGLALGWEDLNDHTALREDIALQTAVGVERDVATLQGPRTIQHIRQYGAPRTRSHQTADGFHL